MIRFIHTADIHFGVENYGRLDPKTGIHTRLLDFEHALNNCIETAIKENVDFFLFCGDAYKTAHPTPTQQQLLLRCFLKLYKAKIPTVIVIGNHDNPLSFGKAHALDLFSNLPINGFHVINKPRIITLKTKNGPIQIVGMPWPTRNTLALNTQLTSTPITKQLTKKVGSIINSLAQECNPDIPAILAAHLTISNGIFSGSEKRAVYGADPILLPSQLAIEPFDYIALGHLHRYQQLNKKPLMVYSGSVERIDFGESKEEKGFCLVTIEKKGTTSHKFIKIPTRQFIQIKIQLNTEENQTEQILKAINEHKIKNAIIKIIYHVPINKNDYVDIKAIQRACERAHYLVGIFPIKTIITRERRTAAQLDMNLESLLQEYFRGKPKWSEKSDRLINKVKKIMQEMEKDAP